MYGVVHCDENNNNSVWNAKLQRVMVIDFDHSAVEPSSGMSERRRKASQENIAKRLKCSKTWRKNS